MGWQDANHPVWRLANLAVIGLLVCLFAWANASNFDATEWRMIGEFMLALGAKEFIQGYLAQKAKPA
jgi:hypothetical protein